MRNRRPIGLRPGQNFSAIARDRDDHGIDRLPAEEQRLHGAGQCQAGRSAREHTHAGEPHTLGDHHTADLIGRRAQRQADRDFEPPLLDRKDD
jgi:hypothetical protein